LESAGDLSKRWGTRDEIYSRIQIPFVAIDIDKNRNPFAFVIDSVKSRNKFLALIMSFKILL
jgi:hypothetical protein